MHVLVENFLFLNNIKFFSTVKKTLYIEQARGERHPQGGGVLGGPKG